MANIILTKTLTSQEFIDDYASEDMNIDSELREQFKLDYPNAKMISSSCTGLKTIGEVLTYQISVTYE